METQLLSTLLVSACLVFLYQVSLLYCGNLRKKKNTPQGRIAWSFPRESEHKMLCKKKRSLEPQTKRSAKPRLLFSKQANALPSPLRCVVGFFFSLKLTVPLEHSARAVQLVTLRHIRPRANANHAPEDICVVAGVQTGNSSDQEKLSVPKAVKEEVVLVSLSEGGTWPAAALQTVQHCLLATRRVTQVRWRSEPRLLSCQSGPEAFFSLQLVVASPRGEADIRRSVGTLS